MCEVTKTAVEQMEELKLSYRLIQEKQVEVLDAAIDAVFEVVMTLTPLSPWNLEVCKMMLRLEEMNLIVAADLDRISV